MPIEKNKCFLCKKNVAFLTGMHMENNYDRGVDVIFHAHFGSDHDMMILTEEQFHERRIDAVICDDCFGGLL